MNTNEYVALIIFFLVGTAIWGIPSFYLVKRNYRTMWIGVVLSMFFACIVGTIISILTLLSQYITIYPALIILVAILLTLAFSSFIAIIFLIINGIQVIRKEGFSFANILPLLLAILLIVNEVLHNINIQNFFLAQFRYFIFAIAGFFYIMLIIFLVACISFFQRKPKGEVDYIIVHGAGLINNQITPLLASRVDTAIALFKAKNSTPKVIMSGGIGQGKTVSEAAAMKAYARTKGLPEEKILLESNSHTTEENLIFSEKVIHQDCSSQQTPNVAIVTSDYHIFRTLLLARKLNVDLHLNQGAKTARYYVPAAILREYVAVLKLHWKSSLFIFILCLLPALLNLLLANYIG